MMYHQKYKTFKVVELHDVQSVQYKSDCGSH